MISYGIDTRNKRLFKIVLILLIEMLNFLTAGQLNYSRTLKSEVRALLIYICKCMLELVKKNN